MRVSVLPNSVRFPVRVVARSSRDGIDRVHGDALKVRVTAAPVEGAANDSVVRVIARTLGVPLRSVRIVAGAGSRNKIIEVDGVTADAIKTLAR